jgi:hypothetical protein
VASAYRFFGLASRFNALAREVDLARDLLAATLGSNPGYLASLAPGLSNCGAPAAESPNSNHTRDRFARER